MLRRRGERAGISRMHAHRLRHTLAHEWQVQGGNETDLMAIMGWDSPEMLRRYGRSAAAIRAQQSHRTLNLGNRVDMPIRTRPDVDVWIRRGCALLVAAVAAYASYQHQREFALHAGADPTSAGLWPLSADGLLVLASTGLLSAGLHHAAIRF